MSQDTNKFDLDIYLPCNGGPVGNGGNGLFESLEPIPDSHFPTNPTDPLPLEAAVYPQYSILGDWMDYVRQYAESADCYLIGSILPVAGAILGRRVWFNLDRRKYPNIFAILCGKPGDRKTTAIKRAEELAKRVLKAENISPAMTSPEGLVDAYDIDKGGHPDKLLIADDANSILANWSSTGFGDGVGKKYLELYDCCELRESFRKNIKDGQASHRLIQETSTSILFGMTFSNCRFAKLNDADGMSRRFLYYVAEKTERQIDIFPTRDESAFTSLCMSFEELRNLDGEIKFSEDAFPVWKKIRKDNRDAMNRIPIGCPNGQLQSALTEAPSHILKVAMIFQSCRHIKNPAKHDWNLISADTLESAGQHVNQCLEAVQALDSISERAAIVEEAESIYAQVQYRFTGAIERDAIFASKTALTNAFAKNPSRYNALKPNRLYGQLLPYLAAQGKCKVVRLNGMRKYAFKVAIE